MFRVLIVDSTCQVCETFGVDLAKQPDIELLGCVNTLPEALAQFEPCDLMLVSTNLPDDGAYRLTRSVTSADDGVQVIIVGQDEPHSEILRLIESGAMGFIPLHATGEEVVRQVRALHKGEAYVHPAIAAAVMVRLAELSSLIEEMRPAASKTQTLTRREREVLRLIGRDYSNQDIANQLIIEVGTVKNHVHNILSKLNVSSRREAASYLALICEHPRPRRQPQYQEQGERYLA